MIAGLLLAAGASTRFASNKLLHPLPDGTLIAVAAARNLQQVIPYSLAIVRPEDTALTELLRAEGLEIVMCSQAIKGMSHSLACGVTAAPNADGWLITLADMPFIAPQTILNVAHLLQAGAAISAPCLNGVRGHPVGFDRRFYADLRALDGDSGARLLLDRHTNEIRFFECEDPGIHQDIDTPADLGDCVPRRSF